MLITLHDRHGARIVAYPQKRARHPGQTAREVDEEMPWLNAVIIIGSVLLWSLVMVGAGMLMVLAWWR